MKEDYPTLRRIFDDDNKMPLAWKEPLKMAKEMKRGLESLMGVRIDPRTFSDW